MESKPWYKSRTIWASIFGVLSGLAGLVAGEISLVDFVVMLQVALGTWGLRLGQNTSIISKK